MLRNLGIISFVLVTSQLLAIIHQCSAGSDSKKPVKLCYDNKPIQVGDDYKLIKGLGYYKFHDQAKNWNDARNECIKEGARLAILNSKKEMQKLLDLFRGQNSAEFTDAKNTKRAWLGAHDFFKENDWVTVTGEPLNSLGYDPWNRKGLDNPQPDDVKRKDGQVQDCGALVYESGQMDDYWCVDKLPFICEVPNVCL